MKSQNAIFFFFLSRFSLTALNINYKLRLLSLSAGRLRAMYTLQIKI